MQYICVYIYTYTVYIYIHIYIYCVYIYIHTVYIYIYTCIHTAYMYRERETNIIIASSISVLMIESNVMSCTVHVYVYVCNMWGWIGIYIYIYPWNLNEVLNVKKAMSVHQGYYYFYKLQNIQVMFISLLMQYQCFESVLPMACFLISSILYM